MFFASFTFLLAFLPSVVLVWWLLPRTAWRIAFLAAVSYLFYAWWDWRYLPILLAITLSDYAACRLIARSGEAPRRRRLALAGALVFDLGALAFFKYAGFFLDSLDGIASLLGLGEPFPSLDILLPVGISFYVFSSLSTTIDAYRGRLTPPRSLLPYAAFVAMFPRLLAGPIARYSELGPQLERTESRLTWEMAGSGFWFLACGLAKKLLVADLLAPQVTSLFNHRTELGLGSGWAAAVGYTLQLYFDFSGYSDMATGVALLLGLRLPQNFDSPYKSRSVSEFWRRWHMTLSFWLRDYLFIPLGGSRGGRWRTARNLLITMGLGGLWHGAGWTFVLWGLLWGCYLAAHRLLRDAHLTSPWAWLNRAATFLLVAAAWVPFRATSMGMAADVWASMIGLNGMDSPAELGRLVGWRLAALAGAALVWVNAAPNSWEITLPPRRRYALAVGLLLGVAMLAISQPLPFLYFQF